MLSQNCQILLDTSINKTVGSLVVALRVHYATIGCSMPPGASYGNSTQLETKQLLKLFVYKFQNTLPLLSDC